MVTSENSEDNEHREEGETAATKQLIHTAVIACRYSCSDDSRSANYTKYSCSDTAILAETTALTYQPPYTHYTY